MGTVQRIRFVGNLGIDTQIDTDDRSFMVSGISKLQKGMPVHLRRGGWSDALCNADTSICERLMGSDGCPETQYRTLAICYVINRWPSHHQTTYNERKP